jgi:hypothetical protein
MRGRILGHVSWGRLPLSGAASVCLGSFSKQGFGLDHLLRVAGGQFLCGVAGGQQTGSRASPVCHLRLGPCLDQALAGSSLSPTGLRENQQPTVHG